MPQLDYSTYSSQIFWLAICLIVLYCVLRYVLIPRLDFVVSMRQLDVDKLYSSAKEMKSRAEDMVSECDTAEHVAYVNANRESRELLDSCRNECMQALDAQSDEHGKKLEELRGNLEAEKKHLLSALNKDSKEVKEIFDTFVQRM